MLALNFQQDFNWGNRMHNLFYTLRYKFDRNMVFIIIRKILFDTKKKTIKLRRGETGVANFIPPFEYYESRYPFSKKMTNRYSLFKDISVTYIPFYTDATLCCIFQLNIVT